MTTSSRSRVDDVERALRRAIIAADFAPGERLSADALSSKFNVSATPIREALARLAGEGLVTYYSQRGVRVSPISLVEMDELYEIRGLLEPLAIERSVARADDAARTEIARLYERMVDAGRGDIRALSAADYEAYEQAHVAFHQATLNECGSSWLIRLAGTLSSHSLRYRHASVQLRERHRVVADEHREILEACLTQDPERASRALLAHIENTRFAVHRLIEDPAQSLLDS